LPLQEENLMEEKMELSHEPVPGYKKIFHIAVLLSSIYLGIIFWLSFS
jgi:hypothetical protein